MSDNQLENKEENKAENTVPNETTVSKKDQVSKFLLLFLLAYVVYSLFAGSGSGGTLELGKPIDGEASNKPLHEAYDFKLSDLDGNLHTLSEFRGKVVLLSFWAPWCSPCKDELPTLDALQKKLGDQVQVLAVATSYGEAAEIKALAKQYKINSAKILLDEDELVLDQYKIKVFPTNYIIDKYGVIRYRLFGARAWDSNDAIDDINTIINLPKDGIAESEEDSEEVDIDVKMLLH